MNEGSRAFWEGRYRQAAAEGALLWGAEPNGWIAAQAAGIPAGRAVDLGAGDGRNALWLAARGWRVTAVDFSTAAMGVLRRVAEERGLDIDAVVADATGWAATEPADLAVLCYLQLEADALAAAIARAAAALAPGGLLLGIWHDREDVERGLAGTMDPIIRTTPDETSAAARAGGLAVRLSGRRDRAVPAGVACDTLLVATRPS